MNETRHCVVFSLDERLFALPLSIVERITRAVAITPLPKSSEVILGVINLQGRVIPVVNIRKRFSFDEKGLNTEQHFIIGKANEKDVAILVDNVLDIIEVSKDKLVNQEEITSNMPYISGVIKQDEEMVLVHDLDTLLSLDEIQKVEDVIKSMDNDSKSKNPLKTKRRTQRKK
ncbi:purine-binding chemotaxis protein CheW [bacterium]|nr:purine-binding chemotaxis protein CheW [bacterium]